MRKIEAYLEFFNFLGFYLGSLQLYTKWNIVFISFSADVALPVRTDYFVIYNTGQTYKLIRACKVFWSYVI